MWITGPCTACRPNVRPSHPTLRRVYGSPQLDALLEGSDERLQQLLAELGAAF